MHVSAGHHWKTKDLEHRPTSNSEAKDSSPLQKSRNTGSAVFLFGCFPGFHLQWTIQYTHGSIFSLLWLLITLPLLLCSQKTETSSLETIQTIGRNKSRFQHIGWDTLKSYCLKTLMLKQDWRCVSSCFLSFNKQWLLKVWNPARLGSQLLSMWDRQLWSECCGPDWTKIIDRKTNYFQYHYFYK